MRKLIGIVILTLAFVGLWAIALHAQGLCIPRDKLTVEGQCVEDFHDRLAKFQRLSGPRTVIIGACYAYDIGEPSGIVNLGMYGMKPSEYSQMLQYLRPTDTVFYVFSLREMQEGSGPRQWVFADSKARSAVYAKDQFQGLISPAGFLSLPAPSPSERTQLQTMFPHAKESNLRYTLKYMKDYESVPRITTKRLVEFHSRHPKTVFVWTPIAPMPRVAPEWKQAAATIGVLDKEIHATFSTLPASVIDLGHAVTQGDFLDLFHLRPEAQPRLQAALMNCSPRY
jgi:hypothetical protein